MTALRPGMTVREVVPGVPSRVLSLADQLRSIAAGFDQGARVFTPGEGAWFGPAFEAFAAVIGAYPPLYRQVAASFGAASVACRAHALELEAAQAQARVALNRVEDAFALTARWQALPEPRPGPDPGAELLRVLTARVAGAQERVEESARLAAARLREASNARIPEPHVAFRVISRAVEAQRQFVFGAVEATYDLGRLAATFSPAGIVTDPKGYAASVVGIGAGLKHGVNHPGEFLAAMVDLDTWRTNPARALGHLAPDAAFTVATGGAGAATRVVTATTRGFETLTKTVNPAPTRWLATRLATSDSPSARSFGDLLAHPERGSIRLAGRPSDPPGAVTLGPLADKVWTVIEHVDAKGSPLPGFKGGKTFENNQGRLPRTEGVTYREWDVNPYVKGVDRGAERLVTGSDGSAYFTNDHYATFTKFRGAKA